MYKEWTIIAKLSFVDKNVVLLISSSSLQHILGFHPTIFTLGRTSLLALPSLNHILQFYVWMVILPRLLYVLTSQLHRLIRAEVDATQTECTVVAIHR